MIGLKERIALVFAPVALCASGFAAVAANPPERPVTVTPERVRAAIEKSLDFLQRDAVQWRKKATCATCHHGAITAWAIGEAKARGFADPNDALKDMLDWSKARFVPAIEEKPNLANGFDIPSLAMPILAATQWSQPDALSADDRTRMAKYILDRQQPDGGWVLQQKNPHPVFESREVLSTWFYLTLEATAAGDSPLAAASRAGREKALAFLDRAPVADTTQAVALRLLMDLRDGRKPRELRKRADLLLKRQNPDGGWSQIRETGSDGYSTGQALYVLSVAGIRPDRKEIQRGVAFLVGTEREDGSFSMVPRVTPERPASKNLEPINHFAVAWATLGLVRTSAPIVATAAIRTDLRDKLDPDTQY